MGTARVEETGSGAAADATGGTTVHHRTCHLCEAMCGLEIQVREGRVHKIKPNRDDVWSKGHICPKGTTLGALQEDPDRLRTPMIRTGDTWREATWDEAFAECERVMRPVLEEHGPEALTAFFGNPLAHNVALARYVGILVAMAKIHHIYSSGTVDQWPKNVSSLLMYGGMWTIPVPDLRRTEDLFVVMGANPQASQGSLLACPDIMGEIKRIRRGGGKVVVIDPRRTGTADAADEWLPIVPGTDAALLMAVVHVLFADDLVDLGPSAALIAGTDTLRELAADWTPESVAGACRIPAARIRELAHQIAAARSAVVYGRIGLCNQEFGTLASWLVDVVNILTGHFDTPGGLMFPKPVNWSVATLTQHSKAADGAPFGRWHSRVRQAPEVLGQVPASCLAEEIDTEGEGRIRALVTIAGNPAVSAPGAARLRDALPKLDAMVSIDNWINETTRHANVILPGAGPLETPHFDDLMWNFAVGSAGKWSEPVLPPADPDRPAEWQIVLRLAGILAGQKWDEVDVAALDDMWFGALVGLCGLDPAEVLPQYESGGPERIIDLSIRTGPWGDRYGRVEGGMTLSDFKAAPNGIDLGPMEPRVAEILHTESGFVELAPAYITADLPRLRAHVDRAADPSGLLLVSRRHLRSKNSWLHNVPALVGGTNKCTLLVHPDDAARAGLTDGEAAEVASQEGSIQVAVQITDEMMPGVVSMPHGWGHDEPGTRMATARAHAGVNSNVLAPGTFVDPVSGNAAVNGIPVTVTPV
ncbi:molybdopterin oxidoreductase family protein [Yinghuangia soli]|uniref:Molybdopterin oxidoreductase family protein n=1 Tax=Yinghuangia soli TaxID=2908204 RepID=A0AA41Q4K0_9ACTN|nr:molybdopterin oxidoreductase family protein [Yinghuangia soli]MCF2530319.1 molybdopterin oxidoreductase family protein [Yinghuangia soli]